MFKKVTISLFLTAVSLSLPTMASAQTFTFGAAGDFANGTNFQSTINAVAQQNPNFMLGLGDFSYTAGAEQGWCGKWKASYNNIVLETGNHDAGENPGGNINNYVSYCPFPLTGLVGTYGQQYYFDYPPTNPIARFIMIRPGVGGNNIISYEAGGAGLTFTQNAIDSARAQGIKWIIVGMHKNYITIMEKDNEIGTALMPMLLSKKVDLVLQGHEHGYERTKQLSCIVDNTYQSSCVADSDNNFVKGAGTIIDVLGTGGQGLRSMDTTNPEYPYFAKTDITTYGFGKFTVSANQLSYNFVRSAGGTMTDSFVINDTSTGNPTATTVPTSTPTRTPSPIPSSTPTKTSTPTSSPTRTPTLTPTKTPTFTPSKTPTPTLTFTLAPTSTSVPVISCSADINGDFSVDLSDYSLLVHDFLQSPPSNIKSDINKDGIVDLTDYSLLVSQFLKPCAGATP